MGTLAKDDSYAAGLDFIGTAEHNTSTATQTWGKYVAEDFLVISGEEVTTRGGHWLATGLPAGTWIDWRYRPEDERLQRLMYVGATRAKHHLVVIAPPALADRRRLKEKR